MNSSINKFFIISLVILGLGACKKNKEESLSDILIGNIYPTSGTKGTIVTINGIGFDETAANNTVLFNGKPAEVLEATSTTLKVESPVGAGTGTVQVINKNGQKAFGPTFYHRWIGNVTTLNVQGVALTSLYGIATDKNGNIYTAGPASTKVYKITPNGLASEWADLGVGAKPRGVVVDSQGNLFVADGNKHCIYKIINGQVSVFAGSTNSVTGDVDANGTSARFWVPANLAIDSLDNIYVAEVLNALIRKITPQADVSTITTSDGAINCDVDASGNLYTAPIGYIQQFNPYKQKFIIAGDINQTGFQDGLVSSARFASLNDIFILPQGDILVTDSGNSCIRYVSKDGFVFSLAGNGYNPIIMIKDGIGIEAGFKSPSNMVLDKDGVLWVTDDTSIRKIVLE